MGLTNHSSEVAVSEVGGGRERRTRRSGGETSDVVRPESFDPPGGGGGLRGLEDLAEVAVRENGVENEGRLREVRISELRRFAEGYTPSPPP